MKIQIVSTQDNATLGEYETLHSHDPVSLPINEFQFLQILLKHSSYEKPPRIFLGDYEIRRQHLSEDGNTTKVLLYNDDHEIRKISFFESQIGNVHLNIHKNDVSNDRIFSIIFDVHTEKIGRQSIVDMISYVESAFPEYTTTQFGLSSYHGRGNDWSSIESSVELIDVLLHRLDGYLYQISQNLPSRLVPQNQIGSTRTFGAITDESMKWLFQNIDQVSHSDGAPFQFSQGRNTYGVRSLLLSRPDVTLENYENKIIHGYIRSLLRTLDHISENLLNETSNENYRINSDKRFSLNLSGLISSCLRRSYFPLRGRIANVKKFADFVSFRASSLFGEIGHDETDPSLTSTFAHVPGYRDLYPDIRSWYEKSDNREYFTAHIFKMKSMSQIFEVFCLLRIFESIKICGFEFINSQFINDGSRGQNNIPNVFDFSNDAGTSVRVFYDFTVRNSVNRKSGLRLVDTFKNNIRPDFIVQIREFVKSPRWLILDAKYTSALHASKTYLSDIIEKYGFRCASSDGGHPATLLIATIFPSINNETGCAEVISLRSNEFSLGGLTPTFPVLLAIGHSPSSANPIAQVFKKLLKTEEPVADPVEMLDTSSLAPSLPDKVPASTFLPRISAKKLSYKERLAGSVYTPTTLEFGSDLPVASNASPEVSRAQKRRDSAVFQNRARRKGSSLKDEHVRLIKGMIRRGDSSQDIAAWFGINMGRVAEIKQGQRFPHVLEAQKSELPPPGPYESLHDLSRKISVLKSGADGIVRVKRLEPPSDAP